MAAWNLVDGAVYSGLSFSVAAQEASPNGMCMADGGTRMYVIGAGETIYEYELSTPSDISTASYSGRSFSVAARDNPRGVFVGDAGSKMYVTETSGGGFAVLREYDLGTPYEIDTASATANFLDVLLTNTLYGGIFFKPDGAEVYVTGGAAFGHTVQHTLSTPWDTSTDAGGHQETNGEDLASFMGGLAISPDGGKLFILNDGTLDGIRQYTLSTPWDLDTETYDVVTFDVSSEDTAPRGLVFADSGARFFVLGGATDTVYQYEMLNVMEGWKLGLRFGV